MKIIKSLLIAGLFVGFYSCKEAPKTELPETESTEKTVTVKGDYQAAPTTAVFKNSSVAKAFDQYIVLKTTLVNSNQERAALAADVLMTYFANLGVEEQALMLVQGIKESESLEEQRKHFTDLTEQMELIMADGITEGTVYKQFCPMANNNKGAYWLSNSEEVYNPYFGDVMLHCGKVTEEITQ